MNSREASSYSSEGKLHKHSIFKAEFSKRLSWSIKIQTLPPVPSSSSPNTKTVYILKLALSERPREKPGPPDSPWCLIVGIN